MQNRMCCLTNFAYWTIIYFAMVQTTQNHTIGMMLITIHIRMKLMIME
jgi:hypothetical protein